VIAGEPKKGSEDYLHEIQELVKRDFTQGQVIQKIQFIPDEEMELYLKAGDVLVLPYKEIFQSGVLFLAYSFGLPVVATDVGIVSRGNHRGPHWFPMPARRSGGFGQSHRNLLRQRSLPPSVGPPATVKRLRQCQPLVACRRRIDPSKRIKKMLERNRS
jgi:hypothetical protein